MVKSLRPEVPAPMRLQQALAESEPLLRLMRLLQLSQDRWAVMQVALPTGLRRHVKPGPLDSTRWVLVADNAAVAAKLRQCLPLLQARARELGWGEVAVKVEVRGVRGMSTN